MDFVHHCDSPLGGITLAGSRDALTGLWFDGQKHFGSTLDKDCMMKPLPVFKQTEHWLDIYFSGGIPDFTPPLSLRGTGFQKSVWEILLAIPYGQTMTYGQIADQIARQQGSETVCARAVGAAVARNPVSLIIPCHRVIGAGGKLTGYAGGMEKKIRLLRMEGVLQLILP